MDIQVISQIITSIGFPIVAAGALFWYINKQRESHESETKALQESLNQNTIILSQLKELIHSIIEEFRKNDK